MAVVSQLDQDLMPLARDHITRFIQRIGDALSTQSGRLLEIGPQDRSDVRRSFASFAHETFDIVDTYKPTHVGDITKRNDSIAESTYDCVVCMEVLEHTLDPFGAVREMRRILKHGGHLLVSAPLNWRIHGPIPDCWRFTEHGFKVLLRDFEIIEIDILETPGRDLFPLHYNVLAKTDKNKCTADRDLKFRFID
ncbi:MAG TPA: methyltransferase domain-containing protein [Planctomycetaceae bacterium]|nr:methyltransferase domain-containing protein [Planctomycetaceae bacterium]